MSLETLLREYAADLRKKAHKSRADFNEAMKEGWGHKACSESARRVCLARIAEDLTVMLDQARSDEKHAAKTELEPVTA